MGIKRTPAKVQSVEITMELDKLGRKILEESDIVEDFKVYKNNDGKILQIIYKKEYRQNGTEKI